ncbi:NAD(P)H-dependent flavin oxidoreductase [Burkholderia lata]|uniref:2-nitropropane dioxygenase, NPD n=1 Tax=Burkholderia lata (strain ATCC 17760 / DSM 23089 / LMG 22485 / NCIMB 9086 / R18194 / 383) TaxID=482957 RepID=Q39P25_BURL3|nr:nitronate monooxygenase [Burkholderia lata]ABB05791.1 2-nitropropane dioxygenase, NPD [Burkholderia lata]
MRGLPSRITQRLRLPLIAAPMLRVSGPDLVITACLNGVVGAFPTANARNLDELDAWLTRIVATLAQMPGRAAPWCPNLIMHRDAGRLRDEVALIVRHCVEMAITSVGSPAPVIPALHAAGCLVFADVASIRHARRAIEAGADGLVLLTAGAGGQTGWLNGFAFVRAVRAFYDGPIVLAGGVSDGAALFAARALGCDLAYMGTRFIATDESLASDAYKTMLVGSDADDVMLTRAVTGLPASMLRPSLVAAGLDPDALDESITPERARVLFGQAKDTERPARWKDIWSAGHAVGGVSGVQSVEHLVATTEREYDAARERMAAITGGAR